MKTNARFVHFYMEVKDELRLIKMLIEIKQSK
jgi:hypothetical protein